MLNAVKWMCIKMRAGQYNHGRYIKTTIHFFPHCSNYSNQRKTLYDKSSNIKRSLLKQTDLTRIEIFFGTNGLGDEENAFIIESTMGRFMAPLLWIHLSKSPFMQVSNWFWITLFHIFQLFSCSKFLHIYILIFWLAECLASRLCCM